MKLMLIDPELEFPKVKDMLYSLAWRTHRTYGIDYDECQREVYYAFVKAVKRYNKKRKKKSSFSTLCHIIATWRLKNLVRERARGPVFVEVNEEVAGYAPPQRAESLELVCDLSNDAKEIISLLLDHSWLPTKQAVPVSRLLGYVKEHIIWQRGPKAEKQVETAIKEIRTRLRAAWTGNYTHQQTEEPDPAMA